MADDYTSYIYMYVPERETINFGQYIVLRA